ncbi:MAG: hypothetical protein ACYS32_11855 [Planctomycetota bacterium]
MKSNRTSWTRVVSAIALGAGITTLVTGLLALLIDLWPLVFPDSGSDSTLDIIGLFLLFLMIWAVIPLYCLIWIFIPVSLVLSIITLFIERNIYRRLLPLVFVLAGICLFIMVSRIKSI